MPEHATGPTELSHLQTPCLLIRLDRVRHNIRTMLTHTGGPNRWRPHVKTAKVADVMDLLLQAGLRRFKCATTKEAQVLLDRATAMGIAIDLLVAFTHRGANLHRLGTLAEDFPDHRLGLLTEDPGHAREVRAATTRIDLWIDVDPDWHRSGAPLDAHDRITATASAAGRALKGVHCYDGHLRDVDAPRRRRQAHQVYDRLIHTLEAVKLDGLPIVTSGTPSFAAALDHPGLKDRDHAVSPGTVVYSDATTESFGIMDLQRAVHVLARVSSAPTEGRITVDAGSKALDAAAGDPCAQVEGWPLLTPLHPSEEHLPIAVQGEAPVPGSLLELFPVHVCPTVNLADAAVLMEGDRIVRVVPVHARGHETFVQEPSDAGSH